MGFFERLDVAVPENVSSQKSLDCWRSAEAVRLLWEGTRKAIDDGIDTDALIALCEVIVRLADHRLLRESNSSSCESEKAAEQLRHYRRLASDLLQWASAQAPEPDWERLAQRLETIGAAPLQTSVQPR
jgi:hypothetical protein